MISDFTIQNMLDLTQTIAAPLFSERSYPWEVLPDINRFILQIGPELPEDLYEKRGENIWVARSATVAPTAYIGGPCIIDDGAKICHCAYIRTNAIIGKGSEIGNSCEVKNAVIFNNCAVPHFNYVGDSVLGFHAHMGAGAITSNLKSDKTNVVIHDGNEELATGFRKMGAILGDYVEVGCNSVLNPGSVVGRHTNIYPLSMVRGCIPAGSIYKNRQEVVCRKEKA